MESKIRSFPDKSSLKDYTSTKPALQDMKETVLKKEEKNERERNTGTKGVKWQLISTYQS